MKATPRTRGGFTLVELLTVIAIIAILAAIIFPVFGTMRRNVSKTSCLANLHAIAQAIKMYKDDYRVYPDALYGHVIPVGNTTLMRTFLYPQYIRDRVGFKCPLNLERLPSPEQLQASPQIGLVDGINGVTGVPMGARYYVWDSYDGSHVPHTQTNSPYLVHYLRRWDTKTLGTGEESLRQLIYRYPPDTTVVTWCTYHRNYEPDPQSNCGVKLEPGAIDLALFLDGRAKPVPANLMQECRNRLLLDGPGHQVTPGI